MSKQAEILILDDNTLFSRNIGTNTSREILRVVTSFLVLVFAQHCRFWCKKFADLSTYPFFYKINGGQVFSPLGPERDLRRF